MIWPFVADNGKYATSSSVWKQHALLRHVGGWLWRRWGKDCRLCSSISSALGWPNLTIEISVMSDIKKKVVLSNHLNVIGAPTDLDSYLLWFKPLLNAQPFQSISIRRPTTKSFGNLGSDLLGSSPENYVPAKTFILFAAETTKEIRLVARAAFRCPTG